MEKKKYKAARSSINISFILIGTVAVVAEMITLCTTSGILKLLKTPPEIMAITEDYVKKLFCRESFLYFSIIFTHICYEAWGIP